MDDLNFKGVNLGEIVSQLTCGRIRPDATVHFDPDLDSSMTARGKGWRPSLGQMSAAQMHLRNNNVCVGDVFLFFGWFREVEMGAMGWQFVRNAPNKHVMFGWLQIGEILDAARERETVLRANPWLDRHPHLSCRADYINLRKNNTVYVASESCDFAPTLQGGGVFSRYRDELCLTWPGRSRTQWRLPEWMMPKGGESSMTSNPTSRWNNEDGYALS